jgi:Mechanosensitive ion channel, conserved TM helix
MWTQVEQSLNQAMVRVLSRIASVLPGLAALVVALLVSIGAAWFIAAILRRILTRVRFDERLQRSGFLTLAEWSPTKSPALLVTRVVAWTMVLIGFLIGVSAVDTELTSQLALQVFAYLPNVLAALVVLTAGTIIARFLSRSVLIGAVNINLQYARLLSVGVKWLVIVLTVAMALEHLAIGGDIVRIGFGILFGGIVLALALAVGLGSKELVSRSLEREVNRMPAREGEESFRHL